MQKAKYVFSTILLIGLLFTVTAMPVVAAGEIGFSVSPILPENQTQGVKGYYDLHVQPGQAQDLTLTVSNRSDDDIQVTVEAITASTNLNGIVDYTNPGIMDPTLAYSFSDLVTVPQERVEIPANSSQNVTATVTLPAAAYEGYLLGGLHVKKELTEEELQNSGMIVNQYSYVVGVKLIESDTPVIAPDFSLGDIQAELVNGRASVVNHIRNTQPVLAKGITTTVKIYPQNSDTPIMERTMADTDMAPNSVFPFTLMDEAGYGLKAGTYLSKVELEHDGRTWNFEQEFTIHAEEAAVINNDAVNIGTSQAAIDNTLPAWVFIVAVAAGALLLAALIAFLVIVLKVRKDNKAYEQYNGPKG